jgi:predicted secreted protein
MKKAIFIGLLWLVISLAPLCSAQAVVAEFGDTQDHWAKTDITAVSGLGLMNGTGINSSGLKVFSPQGIVSHAQLVVALQSTFQFNYGSKVFVKQPEATDYYRDVANDAWYSDSLVMCAINEIFDTGGEFLPDRPVSRIEIAQAIHRSFNAKGISIPMIMMMPVFEDTESLTQGETNAMVFVNNTGIMKGYDNRFRPYDSLTRAELAGVIARCVELLAINEDSNGQTFQIKSGQSFIIGLTSNPSTGFTWEIKERGDDNIITLAGQAFRSPAATGLPIVGQAGQQFFKFQGLNSGNTQLDLIYARPWESVQPVQTFSLNVVVS